MQDEHFMQLWNAGHAGFSEDIDTLARKLGKATVARSHARKRPRCPEVPLARKARLTGIGVVAGILAGASFGMVAPLVTALGCPQAPQDVAQICVHTALA